jgi:glycosyltransferase involved in cell wall biosynthesis
LSEADRPSQRAGAEVLLSGRRVLLVLATSAGGVGVHVRSLADGLADRGALVTVAAPRSTQEVFGFASHAPVEIGARPHPTRDLVALGALRRLARGADLVHAHGLRAGALAVLAGGDRPVVVSWHNAVEGRLGRGLERLVARRASVTLAASDDLAARARAVGAPDVRLAPVAPPPPLPSGRDPGLGHPLVLAVGRLHPQKGYDVLVEALPLLGDAVVAVAGDGPLLDQLRAAAPGVRWLGRRDDVGDLYAAADVVVLPSRWEARSLTAQEALRAGRPLVATAVGGLPGLLRDGAVLVPAGDAVALGTAVRRLLDHPGEAAALAARGRQVAAAWPDEADAVAQAAALYTELLGPAS